MRPMKTKTLIRSAIAGLAAALPSALLAHPGHSTHSLTAVDGLLHPFTGLDHIALLAGGGALLALAQPVLRLTKATMVGLSGVLAGGFAAMIGSAPLALLGVIAAILGFVAAGSRSADGHYKLVLIGTAVAVSAQAASHLLARGDVPPNFAFAAGFGLSSMGIFASACLLTRAFIAGQRLCSFKAR